MKAGTRYTSGNGRTLLGALAVVVLVAFGVPKIAEATTAANTTIRNTVTVNFDDTAGTAMTAITGTVDVTVLLVAAPPNLSAPDDETTDPATAAVYSYTLTSTANGPDTYAMTVDSTTDSAGDFDVASGASLSDASITLGATSVATDGSIAAAGTTDITVPSDDNDEDNIVNGIAATDTVVINGEVFTVASVTDNGGTPGTSTITVNGNGTLTAISVGDVIGEQKSFTLTVTPGTLVASPTLPDITVVIGAQDDAGDAGKATDTTITFIDIPALGVTKEVSTNGGSSFAASASAEPSDTLTYRITVTNNGTSDADSVVITDPIPQFTTYVGGSAEATTTGDAFGSATGLTDLNAGDDGYDFDVTTSDTVTYSAGTIAPGASVILYFQVTIDN